MLNRKLLEFEMFKYGDNQKTLSVAMGVRPNTLMWKLQGKYDFKQGEIKFIANRYNLDVQQVNEIFFDGGVKCASDSKASG